MWNAEIRSQQQGIEKLLAELPETLPEFSVAIRAKRQMIYEDWLRAPELNVVGRCIGERHTAGQGFQMNVEMQERCRL